MAPMFEIAVLISILRVRKHVFKLLAFGEFKFLHRFDTLLYYKGLS